MEKDHLSVKTVVNYEINQRLKLGHGFQYLSVRVLLQPICTGELSEIFTLL